MSLRRVGKHGKLWIKTRKQWFKENPAEYYNCYICHQILIYPELDHIESRTRHPELRYKLSNLAPICHADNQAKGSLSLKEYREKLEALTKDK